tara:strand:+ start:554 stop:916 length:363 start_codon:yes stop_codon:yes gene_type:complete
MNYEDMSDFEINLKISKILGLRQSPICPNGNGNTGMIVYPHSNKINFDPCNNPSDAWPIIVEHGICLTSPTVGRKHQLWSASWNKDGGRWSYGDVTHGDKNPLRAAMICFLKMKDAENGR